MADNGLSLELPGRLGNVCVKDHDPMHVDLSLSVPTVHQKRFRMILPQCATCQEKVRTVRPQRKK